MGDSSMQGGSQSHKRCALISSETCPPDPTSVLSPSSLLSSSSAPSPSRRGGGDGGKTKDSRRRDALTILHFNDVYNIEGREKEPVGGAARFKTCLDKYRYLNPLTLFSGDALSPSNSKEITSCLFVVCDNWLLVSYCCLLSCFFVFVVFVVSVVMKGEQMVPVLNLLDIQCAVYGNHDFGKTSFQ